jgi:hypothetical protein
MYSVAAAAGITGLSKTTVLRAIQAGHISGTKNEINEWQVDPAELHRLYSPEVTRLARENTPPAEAAAARRSGRAEATVQKLGSTIWRRPSVCPVWLTRTRGCNRLRERVGGA